MSVEADVCFFCWSSSFDPMNIFKRRNSIQKTSQKWKILWLEYMQHLQDINEGYDDLKLKILSNFMENMSNYDSQMSTLTSSSELFDEASMILTGLLDVVQRSTIELKSHIENEYDRIVLQEALRKSLIITEILVKEKKNRQKIEEPADIICRVICILSNLECLEDKVITMTIVSYLVRHDQCRVEFGYQEGFKLLSSLYMNQTIILASQSAPFTEPSKGASPQVLNAKILRVLQLALLYERKEVPEIIDRDVISLPSTTNTRNQSAPSLLWGLGMAFSVVNDLIRYGATPLSASWLKRIKGSDLLENEPDSTDRDIHDDSCGGISIVIPRSFLCEDGAEVNLYEWEQFRIEKIKDFIPQEQENIGLDVDDEKSTPDVVCFMKTQGVTSIFIDQMRAKISLLEQHFETAVRSDPESDIICILCTIKNFLIQNTPSQAQFYLEGGYDTLSSLLVLMLMSKEQPHRSCFECTELSLSLSSLENGIGNSLFNSEYHANITFFLLALLYDTNFKDSHFLELLDSSVAKATQGICQIKNLTILGIILKFLENDHINVSMFGSILIEIIVRLNPLSIVAVQEAGGILTLQKILIRSIFSQFVNQQVHDTTAQLPQRQNRSRSSSSGTTSSSNLSDQTASPPSEAERNEQYKMMILSLPLFAEILHILVRVGVICSERTSSILTFLNVLILYICQRLNPDFSCRGSIENCSNCEAEIAEYECTHQSCSSEGLNKLCRECDRVFHKAVTKRSHLRIPVVSHANTLTQLLSTLDCELQEILVSSHLRHSAVIRWTCGLEQLCNYLCLLLYHVRSLFDDRRVRGQHMIDDLLTLLVLVFRLMLTASFTSYDGHQIEISSSSILHAATPKLASALLGRKAKIDSSNSESGTSDEPPEDNHGICHRIILSLLIQIIGRYFTPPLRSDGISSVPDVSLEQRSVTLDRVRLIRQLGLEACLVLVATETASTLPSTGADRQFALSTLREIIVEAYRADISHGVSLLRWLVWLLCSPISSPTESLTNIEPRIKNYSVLINSRLVRELIREHERLGAVFAVIPTESVPISLQFRIFILQEIRILLGGDDWIPVISDLHICKVDARTYSIAPCDEEHDNEDRDVFLRVPVSKHIIQNHLAKAGLVEVLINIIRGDLSTSTILQHLKDCDQIPSDSNSHDAVLTDLEIVDWWSALSTLSSLITGNNYAKEEFDAILGVTEFSKLVLPFIEHRHPISKKTGMWKFQVALLNHLCELCTGGQRWLSPSRPFSHWSKICLLNSEIVTKVPISNCLFCRYLKLISDGTTSSVAQNAGNDSQGVVSELCPLYYTKCSLVDQQRECLFPQVIFRRPLSTTRQCIDPKHFQGHHFGSRYNLEHDCDDSSTGRGSFSLTSLHGFPRACSFSNYTPPPSLAGDAVPNSKFSFDDTLIGGRPPRVNRTDSRAEEVALPPYSGQYIPLLNGLNWGLECYDTLILGVLYEGLMDRSGESNFTEDSSTLNDGRSAFVENHTFGAGSDPIWASLRRQSVEQHLQTFLANQNTSQYSATFSRWEPQYSRILLRNTECVDLLFSLCLLFQGDLQVLLLNSLSRLIDGNPSNADIISQRNIPLSLSKVLFRTDEISRNRISHILSCLFKQRVSAFELSDLISSARKISNVDMKELLFDNQTRVAIPVKGLQGSKNLKSDSGELEDYGCQILFMLGMSIENLGPTVYTHFDQNCSLSSDILLPPIDRIPPQNIGFSVACWINVGNLGIVPISLLMQLHVASDGKIVRSSDSTPLETSQVIDIFFRTVYKPGHLRDCDSSSVHSHCQYDPPLTAVSQDDQLRRRVLQLCVSYRSSKEFAHKASSSDSILGIDPRLISSLAHFSTPDIIIDFDWTEMSEWHLLALSFSSSGIFCSVDGKVKRALYWTALGYSEVLDPDISKASQNLNSKDPKSLKPSGLRYLSLGKDQQLVISLGGLHYEQVLYNRSLESLSDLMEQCKLSTVDKSVEAKITTEVDFLQCYKELIGGFSGFLSTMAVFEGILDAATLLSLYQSGYGSSMISLSTFKKIAFYNSLDFNIHRVSSKVSSLSSTKYPLSISAESMRGRDIIPRNYSQDESLENGRKNTRRISRSLSPVSASKTLERDVTILSYDDNLRGHIRTSTLESESLTQTQTQSSSLVSELITMFSGTPKDEDHQPGIKSPGNDVPVIYGSAKIFTAKVFANEMNLLGGLRFLYPLFVIDRSRQIAVLRIISTLYSSFKSIQEEFHTLGVDKVILFCMYVTPYISTQGSIQIFFDLATLYVGQSRRITSYSLTSKTVDRICRPEFLRLAVDVSLASPKRIQLARCTIEWLLEVCEDSYDNISKVLEHVGLIPFLIILSLWVCDEIQEFDILTSNEDHKAFRKQYSVKLGVAVDERISSGEMYPQRSIDTILSSDPSNFKSSSLPYKIQVGLAKLLRLLITGSIGQLPPVQIPASQLTPTGFSTAHMSALLSFIQYITSHEELSSKSKCDTDVSVTTPIHHPNSPYSWRLYASQLTLDILLEACEGPLFGTIINQIRIVLPGPAIWNFLFDLLRCTHIAIRVRAIHFLGLSLSGINGDIDPRLVAQFEKIQGFAVLSSRLSDSGGDSEPIIESLLSLFFWRRTIRNSSCESGHASNQSLPFGRLEVIEEVESVTGTSEPHRSRQNTIDDDKLKSLTDAALLALTDLDIDNEAPTHNTTLEDSSESKNIDNQLESSIESAATHTNQGGILSIFTWMAKSDGTVEGRLSNEDNRPEPHLENNDEKVVSKPPDPKFGSKMGKLKIKAEVIILPQVLQSILAVLQNENSSERVLYALGAIISSLIPLTVCSGSGIDTVDPESLERCARNADILSTQKDWLIWICECMLCFQRRFSQGNLSDGGVTALSASDAESASGLESGDDSCDGSHHNASRRMSGTGYISPQCNITVLEKFYDPLLRTIQATFVFDIVQKPNTSRKIYDLFRLPVPEARDVQLSMLFDLVDLFDKQPLKTNPERTLNLMRNMSTLLDQVLEKCEITLEFCVRAIQVMNSMIYHTPQEMRLKIKDTLLFDVKLAYVMRCLVDRQEDIWERISCLSSIQTSIIDLISSGIPNRTLQDHYLSILFLDIFLQASSDILNLSETHTQESVPAEYINLQFAALGLIQNCIHTSQECKRSVEKILQTDFTDDQRDILFDGFCCNYGKRPRTPINEEEQPTVTLGSSPSASSQLLTQKSSWWGSWVSSNEPPVNVTTQVSPQNDNLGKNSLYDENHDLESGQDYHHHAIEETIQRPDDSMSFLTWFNRSDNRDTIDILTKKVAKILPSLYQKTDKIQEKIAQRRSRHVRQVQDRHSKDKSALNKLVHETLSKSSSVSEKFGRKYAHDANRIILELKEKIMKGYHEFYKCGEVPTPFDKEPQQRTSQVTSESLPSLVSSEVYRAQNHLPSSSSTSYSVNMLLDQILSDLHSHMY